MQPRSSAFAGVLLGWLLLACSGSSIGPPTGGPVPEPQIADRYASAVCDGYRACCTSKGFGFNQTACEVGARHAVGTGQVCPDSQTYVTAELCGRGFLF